MSKIGFNPLTCGQPARWNMKRADVCGPGGANAIPLMVANEIGPQAALKALRLADVDGFQVRAIDTAENIDTGSIYVGGSDRVGLKLVDATTDSGPVHGNVHYFAFYGG